MNNMLYLEKGSYVNVQKIVKTTRYIDSDTDKRSYRIHLDDNSYIDLNEYDKNKKAPGYKRFSEYLDLCTLKLPSEKE